MVVPSPRRAKIDTTKKKGRSDSKPNLVLPDLANTENKLLQAWLEKTEALEGRSHQHEVEVSWEVFMSYVIEELAAAHVLLNCL